MASSTKVQRPDGAYSWVIAVVCFWITFVTQGLVRCGGVVYFHVIDIYKVDRGHASWPFILRLAVWNLTGPLAGALSYRWSIRAISFVGVLVIALGNALCWFAADITAVSIFFGLIQGLGLGMVMTLVPVIINQYFVKYKTTGAGIACAGGTAGSFAMPPVVEMTVEEYGLHGSFLMMAGITLQGVLGASLMRPAPWLKKNKPISEMSSIVTISHPDSKKSFSNGFDTTKQLTHTYNGKFEKDVNQNPCKNGLTTSLTDVSTHQKIQKTVKTVRFSSKLQVNEDPLDNESSNLLDDVTDNIIIVPSNGKTTTKSSEMSLQDSDDESAGIQSRLRVGNGVLRFIDDDETDQKLTDHRNDDDYHVLSHERNEYQLVQTNDTNGNSHLKDKPISKSEGSNAVYLEPLRNAWTIIKNVMFLVTAINYSVFFLSYMTYLIVIVDYAFDLGVDKTSSVFLVSAFSVADLCGRLGSGWITDSGLVKRRSFMMCNMLMLSALFIGTAFAKTYVAILSVSVATGLVVGMNLILFYGLLEQYLGLQHMAMAVGLMNFMIGCICLVNPSLTGFFRDNLGSYEHLFHFLGVCLFICALLWFIEPLYISRTRKVTITSESR